MATLFHNISGELTQELLAAGDGIRVSQISITNTNDDAKFCSLDLYIEKKLLGKFHLVKNVKLATGTTFVYDSIRFSNAEGEFGLFIKLTKSASETPTVDVIIS
jgi:hypothetical protein|tara:strand:+ start:444 stop:755 length:312 start_codon:yes stop_codon:yes gene_type:complete